MDLTRWMEALPEDVSSAPFPLPLPHWIDLAVAPENNLPCLHTLALRLVESESDCENALALYAARPSTPEALAGVKRVQSLVEVMTPDEVGVAVFVIQHPGYWDMLDSDTVDAWIARCPIDDDAPDLALRVPRLPAPHQPLWSPWLEERYTMQYDGASLLDDLALLWLPAPGAAAFRQRFRKILTELLEESLLRPLRHYADYIQKRLLLALPPEKSLIAQARSSLGSPVPWFACADFPVLAFDGSTEWPLRQAASVVRHLGLKGLGAECFDGRQGQAAPLNYFRHIAEYALALGADALLPRPASMGVLGDDKRADGANNPRAPQAWSEAWLNAAHSLGRLSELLAQGQRVTGVLVLSPTDTISALTPYGAPKALREAVHLDSKPNDPANQYQHPFNQLLDALAQFHIDFDVVDEETLERHGSSQRNALCIGEKAEYHLLVIPSSLSLRASTVKMVRRFVRHGGAVLLVRPFAPTVDFQPDKTLEKLEDAYPNIEVLERSGRDVCYQLLRLNPHPFSIKANEGDASALRLAHRVTEAHSLYFAANTHRELVAETTVTLDADGAVRIVEPWEPGIWLKDTDEKSNLRTFRYNFHPQTADLFAIGGTADLTEAPHQRVPHTTSTRPLAETWEFLRLDPNLAPLHTCRAQMNGEAMALVGSGVGRPGPVAFARVAVGEALAASNRPESTVALSFAFDSQIDGRNRKMQLLAEPAPSLEAALNGVALRFEQDDASPVPGYLTADASEALRVGQNLLEITMQLTKEHADVAPIETPILAGDFAVELDDKGEPVLKHEPDLLRNGDWAAQGYPFFAGTIQLHQTFQHRHEGHNRVFLHIPQPPCAATVRISVGEHAFVDISYAPHRLEVTRRAVEGDNALVVNVTASRYNLFGPIFLNNRLTSPTPPAPRDFDAVPREERKYWNRRPELAPFGLPRGLALETYNPSAPPPAKAKASEKPADEEE